MTSGGTAGDLDPVRSSSLSASRVVTEAAPATIKTPRSVSGRPARSSTDRAGPMRLAERFNREKHMLAPSKLPTGNVIVRSSGNDAHGGSHWPGIGQSRPNFPIAGGARSQRQVADEILATRKQAQEPPQPETDANIRKRTSDQGAARAFTAGKPDVGRMGLRGRVAVQQG